MYESLIKRLVTYESMALVGLFTGQYLMVVAGPALVILGFGIWNPFVVLVGLLSLRLLFLFCDIQQDVIDRITANERRSHLIGPAPKPPAGTDKQDFHRR